MTYEDEKFAGAENVGFVDSVIRASVSIAILVAVMLVPSITSLTLFGLTQLAIYAMGKRAEPGRTAEAPASLAAYPRREMQAADSGHKQAA